MTAEIGSYIKSLREARNYSGRKLGILSRVSNATISRIEDGYIVPSPATLKKLAKPLGISYIELMNKAGYLDGHIYETEGGYGYSEHAATRSEEKSTRIEDRFGNIEDPVLKKWMSEPSSLQYLVLAKRLSDNGINPKFVDDIFISRMIKD